MEFICGRCGSFVPSDECGKDSARCAECETLYDDAAFEVARRKSEVPAADEYRATRMLGRDLDWIRGKVQSGRLPVVHTSDGIRFPLSAVHQLALIEEITVRPLTTGAVLWICAANAGQI